MSDVTTAINTKSFTTAPVGARAGFHESLCTGVEPPASRAPALLWPSIIDGVRRRPSVGGAPGRRLPAGGRVSVIRRAAAAFYAKREVVGHKGGRLNEVVTPPSPSPPPPPPGK